jgi:hypothetical protein
MFHFALVQRTITDNALAELKMNWSLFRTIAALVTLTVCAWLVVELVRPRVLPNDALDNRVIDIQTPQELLPKLETLRRHSGPKVVVTGDSLIYGETMRQHGDREWRNHTLPVLLERALRTEHVNDDVLVMNLGINGFLPGDLEHLARILASCQVDWLVVDMHLRPFSADFAPERARMARPWLRHIEDVDGTFRYVPEDSSLKDQFELPPWEALRQISPTYARREAVESEALENSTTAAIQDERRRLVGPIVRKEPDVGLQLLQLRDRLATVELSDDNPQVQAFDRAMRNWSGTGGRAFVFYAKENPQLLDDVIEPQRYRRLRADLEGRIRDRYPGVVYAPPAPALAPEHYLDFSHLNHSGYRVLTEYLSPFITPLFTRHPGRPRGEER